MRQIALMPTAKNAQGRKVSLSRLDVTGCFLYWLLSCSKGNLYYKWTQQANVLIRMMQLEGYLSLLIQLSCILSSELVLNIAAVSFLFDGSLSDSISAYEQETS